jgi:hypothetical protein
MKTLSNKHFFNITPSLRILYYYLLRPTNIDPASKLFSQLKSKHRKPPTFLLLKPHQNSSFYLNKCFLTCDTLWVLEKFPRKTRK